MDDGELVTRAQKGDRAALEDLLQKHYSTWYQISRRLMGNDADAADATQEAMVAVVKGLHLFDGRAKFSTWSYRVVVNRCHDELRRRNRHPLPNAFEPDSQPNTSATNGSSGTTPDPAGQVVTSLDLDEKLALLTEEFRTILVYRDLLGYDYAEIADILIIPIGTVRSRLARARAKLAELYAQDQNVDEADDSPDNELAQSSPAPSHMADNNSSPGGNFSTSSTVKPLDL